MTSNQTRLAYTGDRRYQPEAPRVDAQGRKLFPYRPSADLVRAVNLAIALERPLLIQGEPGCGKTLLARAIAYEFGQRYLDGRDDWPYFRWNVKSTSKASEGRYTFDALAKLRDAQLLGAASSSQFLDKKQQAALIERLNNLDAYIQWGELGKAFCQTERRPILLIDEIDKADIDFPNDLLSDLEDGCFTVAETQTEIRAQQPPIVLITSNRERELPEAFLRRCLFYYLKFPEAEELQEIAACHFPETDRAGILTQAIAKFGEIRAAVGERSTRKPPSTSELLDWLRVLVNDEQAAQAIESVASDPVQLGILLKSKLDLERIQGASK